MRPVTPAPTRRVAASLGGLLLALSLVACGTGSASELPATSTASAGPPAAQGFGGAAPGQAQRNSPARPAQGERHELGHGLVVTVSEPRSFVPTGGASSASPRAVAFDLVFDNGGGATYRPSALGIAAWIRDTKTVQLVDATQGYSGDIDPSTELRPGATMRLSVAFAVGADRQPLRVTVQPDVTATAPVTVFDAVA